MIEILVTVGLIALNGLFSLSELAVISSRRARLKPLADRGNAGAKAALALAADPGRFLSTVQIGITLVGILAGAFSGATLGGQLADILAGHGLRREIAEPLGFGIVVAIVTYLSVVVGELVPKRLALRSPERIAIFVARPMALLSRIATPVVALLDLSSALILRVTGAPAADSKTVTEEEIKSLIAEGESAGVVKPGERRMIGGVMRLADRGVRAVMTPRHDVEWIDVGAADSAIIDAIRASDRTWLLACDGNPDNVVGVLRARRVLQDRLDGHGTPVRELMVQPVPLPETLNALQALDRLSESRHGFGLVIDEYGHYEGIVTRADALRAIRGDHPGEVEDAPMVVRREDGSFLVDAALPLDALADAVPIFLPPDADYHTVAGLVLHEMRRVPAAGDVVLVGGWRVEVLDMDGRRIDKILMSRVG
ncbi:MAG: HlyC/CorC family transporter [Rhodospirillales bacterium]|nr:MAG: HlyC/CorC family transporter [Rhodospirillales bacterium]